jgi:hypothetical protein
LPEFFSAFFFDFSEFQEVPSCGKKEKGHEGRNGFSEIPSFQSPGSIADQNPQASPLTEYLWINGVSVSQLKDDEFHGKREAGENGEVTDQPGLDPGGQLRPKPSLHGAGDGGRRD